MHISFLNYSLSTSTFHAGAVQRERCLEMFYTCPSCSATSGDQPINELLPIRDAIKRGCKVMSAFLCTRGTDNLLRPFIDTSH